MLTSDESVHALQTAASGGCIYAEENGTACPNMVDNLNLNKRLSDMIDHMPIMCNTFDKDFNIIDCNQKSVEIFGMGSKQEFMERFYEITPKYQPDGKLSSEKAIECIAKAFDEGTYSFDWLDQIPNGEDVPSYVTLVRFEWRNEIYVVAFIYDMRVFHKCREAEQAQEYLEVMAYTDPLTGAYNRRYFMETGEKELSRCLCDKTPFSMLLIDIDHFKSVNDNFGHNVGDEVLKILVTRTRNALKKGTVLARYGGEEFAVILPEANSSGAESFAWGINRAISTYPFTIDSLKLNITVSVGICSLTDEKTLADIIDNADKALYTAKESGRNTVISYNP